MSGSPLGKSIPVRERLCDTQEDSFLVYTESTVKGMQHSSGYTSLVWLLRRVVLDRDEEIMSDKCGVVFGIEYWSGDIVRNEKNCCYKIYCLVLRQGSAV